MGREERKRGGMDEKGRQHVSRRPVGCAGRRSLEGDCSGNSASCAAPASAGRAKASVWRDARWVRTDCTVHLNATSCVAHMRTYT